MLLQHSFPDNKVKSKIRNSIHPTSNTTVVTTAVIKTTVVVDSWHYMSHKNIKSKHTQKKSLHFIFTLENQFMNLVWDAATYLPTINRQSKHKKTVQTHIHNIITKVNTHTITVHNLFLVAAAVHMHHTLPIHTNHTPTQCYSATVWVCWLY